MEETPVKSEFGENIEPKPIVIIPDSFRSELFVDISTSNREEDLKSTNCPQESNFSNDSELPPVNINDDLNRWTVSSSVILPVEKTGNTRYMSDQSVATGDMSVDRAMLSESVKNEDKDTWGTQICELNEHSGHLVFIPNVTTNPPGESTDSDVLLLPLSIDEKMDNKRSRDSDVHTCNESTTIIKGKELSQEVDHDSYRDVNVREEIPEMIRGTSFCSKSFDSTYTLSSDGQTPGKDTSEFSNVTQQSHTCSGDTLICHLCGKGFSTAGIFSVHNCSHNVERWFSKCSVCKKEFSLASKLKVHQHIHTGGKPYKRDVCGKQFTTLNQFSKHACIHTGEKPYTCDVCNKTFTQSGALTFNQRIHTGQVPFKCDVCAKVFRFPDNLKVHQRIHTGETPYKCDVCEKLFANFSHFSKHQRFHTKERPYKCDVCNKTFTRSNDLKTHQRIHTGEKPYNCDVCNKAFTQSSSLKIHQRIHTGQRPYKCDVCNKSFTQSNNLSVHACKPEHLSW